MSTIHPLEKPRAGRRPRAAGAVRQPGNAETSCDGLLAVLVPARLHGNGAVAWGRIAGLGADELEQLVLEDVVAAAAGHPVGGDDALAGVGAR